MKRKGNSKNKNKSREGSVKPRRNSRSKSKEKIRSSSNTKAIEEKIGNLQKLSEDLYNKFFTNLEKRVVKIESTLEAKVDKTNLSVILDNKASRFPTLKI